jgi:hypothetical protein
MYSGNGEFSKDAYLLALVLRAHNFITRWACRISGTKYHFEYTYTSSYCYISVRSKLKHTPLTTGAPKTIGLGAVVDVTWNKKGGGDALLLKGKTVEDK